MPSRLTCRRLAVLAVATAASTATIATPALASAEKAQCPASPLSSPFAPWGDEAGYALVADVEDDGASWSLAGGARVQDGNETFMVGGTSDAHSMRITSGGSAMTPVCIDSSRPSFRFFAKRSGGSADARLVVEVVYADASGAVHAVQAGVINGSDTWAPSPSLPTIVAAQGADAFDAAFRFTTRGGGWWAIDDIYVDPHRII